MGTNGGIGGVVLHASCDTKVLNAVGAREMIRTMAQEPGTENATPWWKSVPAILTAAAAFIGSVAALLALFVGPGGGGSGGSNEEAQGATAPIATPTEERAASTAEPIVPVNPDFTREHKFATEEDVQELLSFVPASLRGRCNQEPNDESDALARFGCDIGGVTFYYELYPDELDALDSFRTSVSLTGPTRATAPAAAPRATTTGRSSEPGHSRGSSGRQAAAVCLQLRIHQHLLDRVGTPDIRLADPLRVGR